MSFDIEEDKARFESRTMISNACQNRLFRRRAGSGFLQGRRDNDGAADESDGPGWDRGIRVKDHIGKNELGAAWKRKFAV